MMVPLGVKGLRHLCQSASVDSRSDTHILEDCLHGSWIQAGFTGHWRLF